MIQTQLEFSFLPEMLLKQQWLLEFKNRKDIFLTNDGGYDVDGDVNINFLKFGKIPIKFNIVKGNFMLYSCKITTLLNCPISVFGKFFCNWSDLLTLEGAPKYVGGDFACIGNKVKFTEGQIRNLCKVQGNVITEPLRL